MNGLTSKQMAWYEDKVAAFCGCKGQRWQLVTDMTFAAAAVGISVDELMDDCRGRMTDFTAKHASDIRRGYATAQAKVGNRTTRAYQSNARKTEKRDLYTGHVKDCIREGGGMAAPSPQTFAAFMDGEPLDGMLPHEQTARWLELLFDPSALMFVTAKGRAENGRICETVSDYCGGNVRPCAEWLGMARRGVRLPGDVITPNPLTGERKETVDAQGRRSYSYIMQSCVKSVPYLIMELDHLPLRMQAAFWLGFLRVCPLADRLASLVLSGRRSIHGLLRVDCDSFTWGPMRDELCEKFEVDEETKTVEEDGEEKTVHPFRIDRWAMSPITKTRIAGALRDGSGAVQTTLFINSNLRARA